MEECNMRLCTVIFPESSSVNKKEYTFKIPKMLYVREGDILRNPNYGNAPMKVVRVFDYPVNNVYNGYILKELLPEDTQIDRPSKINNNQTNNNMEKRNIKVSLEEARNWYNGKDQTLRKLALQAYTENELTEPQTLKEVLEALGIGNLHLNMKVEGEISSAAQVKEMSQEIGSELTLHMKLAFIARYFNGTWRPDMKQTKYFLARTHHLYDLPNSIKLDNDYCIGTHERVMYPGIVYFQRQEDVRKAYEMLKLQN